MILSQAFILNSSASRHISGSLPSMPLVTNSDEDGTMRNSLNQVSGFFENIMDSNGGKASRCESQRVSDDGS